jgi:hypothetical protein
MKNRMLILMGKMSYQPIEKGGKMNIVFALASMIIIYPIIFILPLRIKAKQKLFLLIIALLISLIGILSKNLIPFWQTLLIMVALSGMISILVTKRMPEVDETPSIEHGEISQDTRLFTNDYSDKDQLNIEEIKERIDQIIETEDETKKQELVPSQGIKPIVLENISESDEQTEIIVEEPLEPLYEELYSDLFAAAAIESFEEELEYEEFTEKKEVIDLKEIEQPESTQYLSEIEKLLLDDEFESLIEKEEKVNPVVVNQNESTQIKEIKLEKLY